jgi:hypothetical protein
MRGECNGGTVQLGGVLIRAVVSMVVLPHAGHTIWSACEIGGAEEEVIREVVRLTTVDWCDTDMVQSSSDFPSALIPSAMGKTPNVVPKAGFVATNVGFSFLEYKKLAELVLD